jgi:hypothetical protein
MRIELAVGVGAALGSATPGLAAGGFDGTWNVVIVCADYGDVKGYTWRFPGRVRDGQLSGKYVNPGDALNFGELSGTIGASGNALLTMVGSTGPSEYNVHHEALHTKIHYTASAHFDAQSGSGKRNEQRPCELSFSKN